MVSFVRCLCVCVYVSEAIVSGAERGVDECRFYCR